jgi:hypothetical protein
MTVPLASASRWAIAALIFGSAALGVYAGAQMRRVARHPDSGVPAVQQAKLALAWTRDSATSLLDQWGDRSRERMRSVVHWDFLFIPAYALLLFTLCSLVAEQMRPIAPAVARIGVTLAYAQPAAGLLDCIENVGLLRLLDQPPAAGWAPLASAAASLKWLLVLAAAVYILAGALRAMHAKRGSQAASVRLSRVLHEEYSKLFPGLLPMQLFPQSTSQKQEDEDSVLGQLFKGVHRAEAKALCLSGGGIRSATFGLGVIQGLARHGLLERFDYLSTVSGGGYIGSWLSAWIYRAAHQDARDQEVDGREQVIATLAAQHVGSQVAAESPQLDHLRDYSNYLTPQLGLLSADTWTLIATYARNLLLNWLVLVPLLAAVVLIPTIWTHVLQSLPCSKPQTGRTGQWLCLAGAALGLVVAIAYVQIDLPGGGDRRKEQRWYLWCSLLPLVVAAVLLTAYAACGRFPAGEWFKIWPLSFPVWGLAAAGGAALHVIGYGIGAVAARIWPRRVPPQGKPTNEERPMRRRVVPDRLRRAFRAVGWTAIAVLGSGALGGLGLWLLSRYFPDDPNAGLCVQGTEDFTALACFGVPALLALFFVATTFAAGLFSKVTFDEDREWWARSSAWVLIVACGWIILFGAVLYSNQLFLSGYGLAAKWITSVGGLSGLVSLLAARSSKTSAGRRPDDEPSAAGNLLDWAVKIGAPIFLLFLVVLLTKVIGWLLIYTHANSLGYELLFAVAFALTAILASLFVDVNQFSLHAMYRNRLIRAYLGASRPREGKGCRDPNPFTGFDPLDDIPLRDIRRKDGTAVQRPFHVINATVNLSKGTRLAWQHRRAASFTFTPLYCGSTAIEEPVRGLQEAMRVRGTPPRIKGAYQPTKSYGGPHGVTLGTALATSGAAVTPNVGYSASPVATLLLSLFNARLGWWLGNPADSGQGVWNKVGPSFGLKPLLSETFGTANDQSTYVLLSDGGHFEDLGLYEMVLRRCRVIVVADAGCDPKYRFDDLGNAVRKIRIDLGIRIDFQVNPSMDRSRGCHVRHYAIGDIHYADVDGPGTPLGTLVYMKPVLTGDEPADVLNYAAAHDAFPHESTGDQWFDEDQFESYRMLGVHSVDRFCAEMATHPVYKALRPTA